MERITPMHVHFPFILLIAGLLNVPSSTVTSSKYLDHKITCPELFYWALMSRTKL